MTNDHSSQDGPSETELQIIKSQNKGFLGVAEFENQLPFKTQRIFFFCEVPEKINRGGHAHHKQQQFIICLSGRVILKTVSASGKDVFTLDRPSKGVYLPPMTWTDVCFEESNSIVIVLTCSNYEEIDYIRDFDTFLSLINRS